MSNHRYPPAYLRYLKARLWNLSNPAFWGTAIFLFLLGLVIREYWSNPNIFTQKQNNEVTTQKTDNSSLSPEDKAIAADIDNLPVLYNEVEQATSPVIVNPPTSNSQSKKEKDLLQDLINKQKSSKSPKLNPILNVNNDKSSNEKNPFVAQTENLLQFGGQSGQNISNRLFTSSPQPKESSVNSDTARSIGFQRVPSNAYNSISTSPTILQPSTNQTLSNINSVTSIPGNGFASAYYNQVPQNLSGFNNNFSPASYNQLPQNLSGFSNNYTPNSYNQVPQNLPNFRQTPYNQIPQNSSTNSQTFLPNTNLNSGSGYIQPNVSNSPASYYNGVNTVQPLLNQVPSTTTTQPVTPTAPYNTTPNSVRNPYSTNAITPAAPASYQKPSYFTKEQLNQLQQSGFPTTP